LPRGLGDDPLSRRKRRSNASSTNMTNDSAAQQTVSPSIPDVAVAPQISHNEVFFQRRTEDAQAGAEATPERRQVANLAKVTEIPEIAEVIDILRIAEVAQSMHSVQVPVGVMQPAAIAESPHPAADEQIARVESSLPMVADPAIVAEAAPPRVAEQAAAVEPSSLMAEEVASQPEASTQAQSHPESQKSGGFFRRLFGRFGK
jgi:hypothetical protein